MREIRTDTAVLVHAISDAINAYLRELTDRGIVDREAWEAGTGADGDLTRLKYEVAEAVAETWTVSWRNDEA